MKSSTKKVRSTVEVLQGTVGSKQKEEEQPLLIFRSKKVVLVFLIIY